MYSLLFVLTLAGGTPVEVTVDKLVNQTQCVETAQQITAIAAQNRATVQNMRCQRKA